MLEALDGRVALLARAELLVRELLLGCVALEGRVALVGRAIPLEGRSAPVVVREALVARVPLVVVVVLVRRATTAALLRELRVTRPELYTIY